MERLTVDYGKKFSPFRYAMKDGSDAEIGYFKNYDAFYSHMLMVQKLGEYEDLEEQGLLLRLPCKVGDRLYRIDFLGFIISDTVHSIHILQNTAYFEMNYWDKDIFLSEVGKTVFLTKEEAEQKLKEMERD